MKTKEIKFYLSENMKQKLMDKKTPYVFKRNAKKSPVHNTPLLVVGLGGSGYEALSRVKEKMYNCFVTDEKGNFDGIEFLEIDTDDKDMKKCLAKNLPWGLKANEFKIFQNADIGAILRARANGYDDVLPKEIDEWLDPQIPIAQIVHGAAGIRQAGRLLLHLNSSEIKDAIDAKIERMIQGRTLSKDPVNVVIFTGLGGGTGSGIFIDTAYMIRQLIKKRSGQATLTGIMLMPDILSSDLNIDKITRENIKRNGFAALKELDHLMNPGETKDSFYQCFPDGFEIEETSESIFERCILVSSMVEGRLLLPNAKEHAYNIASEMLIEMVRNSNFYSNASNDVTTSGTSLNGLKNRKPAKYEYMAVGGQAVYLDFDLAFNIFVKEVMKYNINRGNFNQEEIDAEIEEIWTEHNIDAILKELEDAKDNMANVKRELHCVRYTDETGKKKVAENLYDLKESFYGRKKKSYEIPTNKVTQEKYTKELETLDAIAEKIIDHLQMIYSDLGYQDNQLILGLKSNLQEKLNSTTKTTEDLIGKEKTEFQMLQERCDAMKKWKINKPKNQSFSSLLDKVNTEQTKILANKKYSQVVNGLVNAIGEIFVVKNIEIEGGQEKKVSTELGQFYGNARNIWSEMLACKYESELENNENFAQESISEVWARNDSVFGVNSIVNNAIGKSFRNVTVDQYIHTIESIVEGQRKVLDESARKYKNNMTDSTKTAKLQGETGISPHITTGQMLDEDFKKIVLDWNGVVSGIFEDVYPSELVELWKKVIEEILNHSGVLYSKKAMRDGEVSNQSEKEEFSVPKGNDTLRNVYRELTGKEAQESDIENRIACMKYTTCYKLDDYIYIDELESVYNHSHTKSGLHLYSNNSKRWIDLPSPVYRNGSSDLLLKNTYVDAKYAIKYRYIFMKAYLSDLIVYDPTMDKMVISAEMYNELVRKFNENHPECEAKQSLNNGNVAICTLDYGTTREFLEYFGYCMDWFVKMFTYRNHIAELMELNIFNIKDNTLDELYQTTKKAVVEKAERMLEGDKK